MSPYDVFALFFSVFVVIQLYHREENKNTLFFRLQPLFFLGGPSPAKKAMRFFRMAFSRPINTVPEAP